ncbi:M16 family metallopeptidase [Psychromonas sp. KJ10-10]|uniref:M16 family metallopeptidase n=1 Tax=Psychromonas sp. KJ10-10 TaxID=3391823 RepID=UPI0039B63BE7
MKYLPLLVSLSVAILSACQVTQDTTPSDSDTINKTSTDRAIANAKKLITGQLENGMTYVIKKEPQFKNKASLQLLVKAGALQEDEKQRGLAHFVEHMAFNGTEDFPKNDLINYIESAGMKFGQGINAMTYFDKTVYSLIIPTNKSDLFESGFQIIENWAHKVSFDPQEIDKERGVIIEEWRNKDSANYRLESKHLSARYEGSRYSQRYPIVGELDDIKFAKAEDIIRFYKEWYQPENMVILAIGDFEPYQAMHYINKYIATIPASKPNKKIHQYPLKKDAEPIISIQTDPQATMTLVSFQLNKPYKPTLTYKDELENIKQLVLINLLNRRLKNAIRNNNIATINAKTKFQTTIGQGFAFNISATINPKESQQAIKGLLAELYRPTQDGFDKQELDLIKSALKNTLTDRRKSTSLLTLSSKYIHHIMNDEPLFDNHSIATYRLEAIDKVTLDDINRFAKHWLTQQQNREIYISAPDSDLSLLPTQQELLSLWQQAENANYSPYQQEQIIEELMPHKPSKGNIVKREYNKLYRSHHWTLSNGAKVILKKRGSKKNELLFQAIKEGGYSKLDDDTYRKTIYSTNFIDYMGVSDFNINTLNTFLYDKNIKLSSNFNSLTAGLKGSASADYLDTFMQLVYLKFTQQRKSEQDFNSLIASKYSQMEKNSRVPLAKLIMEINAQKNKYNPRYIEQYDPAILNMIDFELSFKNISNVLPMRLISLLPLSVISI